MWLLAAGASALPAMTDSGHTLIHDGVDIGYDPSSAGDRNDAAVDSTTRDASSRIDMNWDSLSFSVPLTGAAKKHAGGEGRKVILDKISGHVRAGQVLAILGPSGSGKTSLLTLLAGRANATKGSSVSGNVLVNGAPRDFSSFSKQAAYVQQDDDMFGELTVREQITYAARLRLPSAMSTERKQLRVDRCIQELGLAKVENSQIGNETIRGVSGGERKRVSIATELVADAPCILLDEPTSGLDAASSVTVISTLRRLASNGRTIVTTIHQPRSSIFNMFDMLMVLSAGRTMYFGPAKDAVGYFSSLQFPSPTTFNPADFFLDLVSVDPRDKEREADTIARIEYLGDRYVEREASGGGVKDADELPGMRAASGDGVAKGATFQRGWPNEFRILVSRALRISSRAKVANGVRLVQTVFFGIVLALLWLNNGRSDEFGERASLSGFFFFVAINQAFIGVFSVIFDFPLERSVVTRERASATYRTSSYYISKLVTDVPRSLFYALIFTLVTYFIIGLKMSVGAFLRFYLVIFLISVFGESLAIAISILTGNAQTSASLAPVVIIISVLFAGFFTQTGQIPGFVRWIKWISFVYYAANAFAKVEFSSDPRILEEGGYNDMSYWANVGALFGIVVALRVLGYLALRYLRGPKFLKF